MSALAIIGGSGLYNLDAETGFVHIAEHSVLTPYASEPVRVHEYVANNKVCFFIPRHGTTHNIPPHQVNYRANIWALKLQGAKNIIAVNAVGGISSKMSPGTFVVPDQLIDYTWGRESTFYDGLTELSNHIDFTEPYDSELRERLIQCLENCEQSAISTAVYGCTQGPRLETAAEINRMQNDGCDIVGMTAMPEAALAREADIGYASIALVVNWAAGKENGKSLSMDDIIVCIKDGTVRLNKLFFQLHNS